MFNLQVWRPFEDQTQNAALPWRPFNIHPEENPVEPTQPAQAPVPELNEIPGDAPGELTVPGEAPGELTVPGEAPGELNVTGVAPGELNIPGDDASHMFNVPGDLMDLANDMDGGDMFARCDFCKKDFLKIQEDMKTCVACLMEENKRLKAAFDNLMTRETCKNCDRNDN